jgi:hypothetical protein
VYLSQWASGGANAVTAYGRTSPIGGAVTFSADMQGNGTHTRTTF